jgi:hypothetical protein
MSVYTATPYSRKKIRELTNLIRSIFGLVETKFFPIVQLLEVGLPQIFEDFNLEIVSNNELPNQYGVTYPAEHLIRLREDVYERAISGVPRDRFTIAHEIGHFIMHRPAYIALARNEGVEDIPAYKNPEWQANTFAAELLAPPHIIKGLSAAEVALMCGVSKDVASIQLKNL